MLIRQDSRTDLLKLHAEMTKEEIILQHQGTVPRMTVTENLRQETGRLDNRGYPLFSQHGSKREDCRHQDPQGISQVIQILQAQTLIMETMDTIVVEID